MRELGLRITVRVRFRVRVRVGVFIHPLLTLMQVFVSQSARNIAGEFWNS